MNKRHIPKIIILASLAMMVISAGVILASAMKTGPKPRFECVSRGVPSSGFSDKSQGNCPISIESYNKVIDWEKGIYGDAKFAINRTMGVIFLLSLVGLITGGVMSKQAKKAGRAH
ncbi:MAG: hypothetical protein Q4F02_04010 [Candidatus Saccharibacteria bacterium]|nr:hypothetical protein [Candidatus Saccharibacteria bacterium]